MPRFHTFLFLLLFSLLALPAQAQAEQDEPRPGEGITAFLQRHGRRGKVYYQDFLQLNEKKLKGKRELQLGVKYIIPPRRTDADSGQGFGGGNGSGNPQRRTSIDEPLFGKALAHVDITGRRLEGACFYVVSGHGGPDPGAIGRVGNVQLHEDEYAYDVALRLARCLMQEGAEVHIIIQDAKDGIRDDRYLANSKRETCMGRAIPLNQKERLKQRCAAINELYQKDKQRYKYCRAIFLHVDSRNKGQQTDVFFYHANESKLGQRLATTMKATFESKYGRHQPGRGFRGTVSGRGLYVLRNSAPVGLFVELGNIQNAHDQRRFVLSSNRQALAKWMMEGFIADYKKSQ